MQVSFHIVDVFTDKPYAGNQLCVVPEATGLTGQQMQRIAAEIGFSETTFILPADGPSAYRVRIFTPTKEIPFAGHPSLGSAYVMAMTGALTLTEPCTHIYQQLNVGTLAIELYVSGGEILKVAMEQGEPVLSEPVDAARLARITEALSLPAQSSAAPRVVSTGLPALILPVQTEAELYAASPGAGLAAALDGSGAELCYLFCEPQAGSHHSSHHYVARAFAPSLGITEDPATGSAAGALGAYLSLTGKLRGPAPTTHLTIAQGHAINRPSTIEVEVRTGSIGTQIWVGGQCAQVAAGHFFL